MSQHKDAKTGKWYYTGKYRDIQGNRHDYKKRGFASKKAAKNAEDVFLAKMKGSTVRVNLDTIVKLYAEEYEIQGVKEATLVGSESYYNNHLKDYFGNKFVDEIEPSDVENWKVQMARKKKPAKDGDLPTTYAESTVNLALVVLSKYLSFAVQKGFIKYNPVRSVKKYKDINARLRKKTKGFWEVDEYQTFIEKVDDPYWHDVFEFLFGTGVREGELFALTWENVDFKNSKIKIERSITSKTREKGLKVTTPKTESSFRSIDMQNSLSTLLQARYERAKLLDGFNEAYYVFGDQCPLARSTLARHLDYYIKISGVSRITPHGFRHSHATTLIEAGIDDSLIAERLGHTVNELRKTYAHVYNRQRASLKSILDNLYDNKKS